MSSYPRSDKGVVSILTNTGKANRRRISTLFGPQISRIATVHDITHEIAAQHAWTFDTFMAARREAERAAYSAFQKTKLGLFDALELTRRGAFGSARPVLRQVFEALVLAKFCILNEDETLAIRWNQGGVFYLTKQLLRKIKTPDPAPIEKLWGVLCNYTHASIYAQQRTADVSDAVELHETSLTLTYLEILAECAYHVLNSHILRSDMRYFAAQPEREFTAPRLRRRAHKLFRSNRARYGPGAITFLRVFKRKWQLAPMDPSKIMRTWPSYPGRDFF